MTTDNALARLEEATAQTLAVVHLHPAWVEPATLYDALRRIDELSRCLRAVISQSRQCCDRLVDRPDLRADDFGEPAEAAVSAYAAATALDVAKQTMDAANAELRAAHALLSRLYLATDEQTAP